MDIAPGVTRITARNPGAFAGWGTNTYLVGDSDLAIIDPGPDLDDHWAAMLRVIGDRRVTHICVSHLHPDHSPLAWRIAQIYQAPVLLGALTLRERPKEICTYLATSIVFVAHHQIISGYDWGLRAVHTPGHTWGHVSYELIGARALFSGDHVMGWATPAIQPPEGDMDAYLQSLDETIAGDYALLMPAHGPMVEEPARFLENYRAHRLAREHQVRERIAEAPSTASGIVEALYHDLPERLTSAAIGTTTAHLLRLEKRGLATRVGDRWRHA